MSTITPAPLAVDVREAGRLLGLHPETVARRARLGEIPHVRVGRAIRFPVAMLADWLTQQATASTAASTLNSDRS